MSDSLWPHEPQHARPPCPSPTPAVHPNTSPLSRWCHPTISSSVVPFSSCAQSFPASGSFQMSQLFASGGQNIGVLFSTSILPMNTQDWSPLGWIDWISLQSKGLSSLFQHHSWKASILWCSAFFFLFVLVLPLYCYQPISLNPLAHMLSLITPWTAARQAALFMDFSRQEYWSGLPFPSPSAFFIVQLSHPYMTTGKTIALTRRTFVDKVMSLLFNRLSRLVTTFLLRSVF